MSNPLLADLEEIKPPLGVKEVYSKILTSYSEPERKYFTIQRAARIRNIFLGYVDESMEDPEPNKILHAKMAIWFKDIIKNPLSLNNETASAELAGECLKGVYSVNVKLLQESILAFDTRKVMPHSVMSFAVDAENSVLGSHSETYFEEYLPNIRSEYEMIKDSVWYMKRSEFIKRLLAEEKIFFNIPNLEERARENLHDELRIIEESRS